MSDFAGIEVTPVVARAFAEDGIREPTAIQAAVIGEILTGQPVVIESSTGTGKTLAYLLPLLERLARTSTGRTVVMAPSAELALQILATARRYKEEPVTAVAVVAGGSRQHTKDRLQKNTRLVVGTAGRILDLYRHGKLKGVTTMVLDEPDPILVDDHGAYLREILSRPEPRVQLIIAGATLGPKSRAFIADTVGGRGVHPKVEATSTIEHHYVPVRGAKDVRLSRFLEDERCRRAIVFASQPQSLRHLFRYLTEHRHRPVTVSDERPKQERRAAIDAFTAGEARVLLVTDAAARGLDIPDVEWVLHYELPRSADAYVHRAGRTGRAGRRGVSVAFVTDDERALLMRFARELGVRCSSYPRP